jgi:hypothetical protein
LPQYFLPFSDTEVQGDTLFVTSDAWPPQALTIAQHLPSGAHGIAFPRGFDLNDFGAKIRQQASTEWASEQHASFDDP